MLSPDPIDLLAALSRVLRRLEARWYLFGAQAVLIWGRPRFTADVDVTVRLEPEEPERLVDALAAEGIQLRVSDADSFVRRTRVLPFVHLGSGVLVDVVLAGPGLEEQFLDRAIEVPIAPGLDLPVISPEDLVVTKILAGRPKDIDDVEGVLDAQFDHLDASYVRATLRLLEGALAMSDLVPAFEAVLDRTTRRRRED